MMNNVSSRSSFLPLLTIFLCQWFLSPVSAYVNHKSAVPAPRALEFLKQITGEIIESPMLTDAMIADSHRIMKGWSTTATKTTSKENAVAVENLVKRLVDEVVLVGNVKASPTTNDYNCMLESWARSGEGTFAAERCEQILTQMQTEYETGNSPQIQPDLGSFKIVLQAWKHAGGKSLSSFRAQRVLDWMNSLYNKGKNDLALPDQMCYDTVLQSWARNSHEQAPIYAELLLSKMETLSQTEYISLVQPRTLSYNAVLGAWGCASLSLLSSSPSSFSSKPSTTSWQRSCDILNFMEKSYFVEGNKRLEPDRVSYSLVLKTLARHKDDARAAPKADNILKSIEKNVKSGDLSWKPETLLFNTVMGCWARSQRKGAYKKTRSILDRQLNYYSSLNGKTGSENCRPDVYGFTTVLSSCATESGDRTEKLKAFNVAVSTYKELIKNSEEYGSPNHVTYGTMLKCVTKLLPHNSKERQRWAKEILGEAVKNGCVGDMVLIRLREIGSPKDYHHLMQGYNKGTLPEDWSRNVKERNDYRRKVSGKRAEV